MSQFSPADIKPACSVASDFTDHDQMLQDFIDAAETHVAKYVRRDLDAEFPDGWPPNILQVVRMLVAHFYTNREAVLVGASSAEIPFSVTDLLAGERNLAG